jgi:hypothetical protein
MTAIDNTVAGPQHVQPGTEKASDATMGRHAAAKPLRASAPQQPCDRDLLANQIRPRPGCRLRRRLNGAKLSSH